MGPAVDAFLTPGPDVAARDISDGVVLVNMGTGACFELNRMGFEIWKLLTPVTTVAKICEALAGRYDVRPDVLAADVRILVDALVSAGLVEAAPATSKTSREP